MKTLFVRPSHDDVVSYLYFYSKELVEESRKRNFETLNKEKKDATQKIISDIILKNEPAFIMFNGHGSPNIICGHNDGFIIIKGNNHGLLKNKIVYSLSCSSAAGIGKAVADKNTAFIGYTDEFALGMDVDCQASIHRDKRARLFLEPSNLLVKSLLKGNSAVEAVEKAKRMMKENISRLRTEHSDDAKDYLPFLFNNYLILEVLGEKNARLQA
ncbi:MAG TPA: hypothetical protein VJI75_02125 [Candidatus Nanoarchaeia archaeon]|nr:hypothetical protein [Candidatus Nanoarchaeia archaeon]